MGAQSVVLSLGARGVLAADSDGHVLEVVPPRVDALCPIGAGDALAAAFVWALDEGRDFAEAVRWAWRLERPPRVCPESASPPWNRPARFTPASRSGTSPERTRRVFGPGHCIAGTEPLSRTSRTGSVAAAGLCASGSRARRRPSPQAADVNIHIEAPFQASSRCCWTQPVRPGQFAPGRVMVGKKRKPGRVRSSASNSPR